MSVAYFSADPHIGHPSVARRRGFTSVEEHDAWYTDMWRSTVRDRDQVYILGDVAVHHPEHALALLADLPGTKHLVAGNHDPVHPMYVSGYARWYRKFSEVFETIQPFRTVKVGGFPVLLSHFPYMAHGDGFTRGPGRYKEWRLPDTGRHLLHGHTHGVERGHGGVEYEDYTSSPMLHVGIDAWGQLVPESWVAEWTDIDRTKPQPAWLGKTWYHESIIECETPGCDPAARTIANHKPRGRFFTCR